MARADYFRASCPETWQVLGVRLRPFSLGHFIKLYRLGCSFVLDDADRAPTLADLVMGVAVCSMSSHPDPARDEFWRWWTTLPPEQSRTRKSRKKQLSPAELELIAWGQRCGKFDLEEKSKLFHDYIRHHSTVPGYWVIDEPKPSQRSGAHWAHRVIAGLTAQCGYTAVEAHNLPVGKCLYDYLLAAEQTGSIRLMSDEQMALADQMEGADHGA